MGLLDGQSAGLLFQIKADASDAIAAFNKVDREVTGLSKSAGGLTSSLSGLVNPATLAAAGITAIATAAAAGAAAIFTLSKQTADYGEVIFDASQKTGLHAEALSALRFAAEQSGSSFEQMTKGIVVFGAEVGKAAQGNDKAVEKMKLLKVTSNDLETALGQVFKTINAGKNDTDKLALATEAFGKRIGPDLIPLIKEANGDLNGLIATGKKLGITLTDEDVKAADAFNDTLDLLGGQAKIVAGKFVTQFMPDITTAMKGASDALASHQKAVKEWGESTRQVLSGLKNISADLYSFSQTPAGRVLSLLLFGGVMAITGGIQQLADPRLPKSATRDQIEGRVPGVAPPPGDLPDAGLDEQKKVADERRRAREAAAKRDLETQSTYIDLQVKAIRQQYQDEQEAAEKGFLDKSITQEQFIERSKKALAKYSEDTQQYLTRALDIDSKGKNADEILNLRLAKTQAVAAIGRDIARQEVDNTKLVADAKKKAADEDAENREEAFKWIVAFEEERAKNFAKEFADQHALLELEEQIRDIHRDTLKAAGDAYGDQVNNTIGKGPAANPLANAKDWVKGLPMEMIGQFAQGIGSIVENLVLMGDAGPHAFRKLTASILANVAAQAAVQAIMELAYGFAALTPWGAAIYGPAPLHFQAAALFGSVAAIAGVAGRLVAGDSFKQDSARGGSKSPGSVAGSGDVQNPPPISRTSSGAFDSGQRQQNEHNAAVAALAGAVQNLHNKISGMRPGDVVAVGAAQRPDAVAGATVRGMQANAGYGYRFRRTIGG